MGALASHSIVSTHSFTEIDTEHGYSPGVVTALGLEKWKSSQLLANSCGSPLTSGSSGLVVEMAHAEVARGRD